MRRRAGLSLFEALIVFAVLCGLWCALLPGREEANRTGRCSARQLGLAAIQYADGSYFPHALRADADPVAHVARADDGLALWRLEAPCGLLALLLGAVLLGGRRGSG